MSTNKRIIFQRILCPIDLTPESDESLRYGIALAKAYGAELLVINCTDSGAVSDSRERDQIKGFLDTAVRKHLRLPASADFGWRSVVIHGDPKTAISQEAAERRADLIVMRSRRRPYAAALLGSTAESVCRTAPCPVMITHPREQDWAGATTNDVGLQRVLVAYDFSTDSELALSYGLSLAQEYQAEIHLLHVLPSVTPQVAFAGVLAETGFGGGLSSFHASSRLKDALPPEISLWCETKLAVREGPPTVETWVPPDSYIEALEFAGEEQARSIVNKAGDRVAKKQARDLRVTCEVVRGHPKHAIIADAEAFRADLIVVGSHGYRGLTRLWLGSVSQAVASHAKCSVEIVRVPSRAA